MLSTIKNFFKEEEGMGTVEIVIIVAVLVSIALIFKNTIYDFVTRILDDIFTGNNPTENSESDRTKTYGQG